MSIYLSIHVGRLPLAVTRADVRSLGTEGRSTKGCPIAELQVTLFRFNSFKDSWPNSLLCIGKGLIQRIGKLKSMQREDINPEAYVPPDRTSAPLSPPQWAKRSSKVLILLAPLAPPPSCFLSSASRCLSWRGKERVGLSKRLFQLIFIHSWSENRIENLKSLLLFAINNTGVKLKNVLRVKKRHHCICEFNPHRSQDGATYAKTHDVVNHSIIF